MPVTTDVRPSRASPERGRRRRERSERVLSAEEPGTRSGPRSRGRERERGGGCGSSFSPHSSVHPAPMLRSTLTRLATVATRSPSSSIACVCNEGRREGALVAAPRAPGEARRSRLTDRLGARCPRAPALRPGPSAASPASRSSVHNRVHGRALSHASRGLAVAASRSARSGRRRRCSSRRAPRAAPRRAARRVRRARARIECKVVVWVSCAGRLRSGRVLAGERAETGSVVRGLCGARRRRRGRGGPRGEVRPHEGHSRQHPQG